MKILYIEDNEDARDLVQRGLENAGQTVLLADNEFTGLELAHAERPDVILLDISLKELDGLALAVQLRAMPGLEKTVLLALTAGDTIGRREHVLAAGCVGYLKKPIEPSQLMARIEPYVKGKREELPPDELIRYMRENSKRLVEQLEDRVQALHQQLSTLHTMQQSLIRSEQLAATGRMALMMAHEISNPLQAVQSALELLIGWTAADDRRREYLEIALKEARRAAGSIHNLLDVYTPEAEQTASIDLAGLIRDIVTLTRKNMEDAGIQVEFPMEMGRFIIQGAYAQFHQLILNLALNAIEAMPGGGLLRFNLSYENDCIAIAVSDNGPGIPDSVRLFEPFYTTKPTGHGLGLYICWLIAEAYGARLEGYNNDSGGATFTLKVPISA